MTTTLTPRPGAKQPASQPAQQTVSEAVPATNHAAATVPARTIVAEKANKPWTNSPIYGPIPPITPAPGFALADDFDPATAQATLDYVINWLVGDFEAAGNDAAEVGA